MGEKYVLKYEKKKKKAIFAILRALVARTNLDFTLEIQGPCNLFCLFPLVVNYQTFCCGWLIMHKLIVLKTKIKIIQ